MSTEAAPAVQEQVPFTNEDAPKENALRNQFYFADRASQSFNALVRGRGVSTEPPPRMDFSGSLTQWAIYDAYMAEADEKKASAKFTDEELADKRKFLKEDPIYNDTMDLALRVMERLVNQNSEKEVYVDYKFWEDKSDEFRDGDGTLLPLWRFSTDKTRKKQVTSIKWNPKYSDLFAVSFGSYDYLKQSQGTVCCYSLKNTRFPEYIFMAESGVCSLDWNPQEPALICVGLYDGGVAVYDVRNSGRAPIYQSAGRSNKHTDPVWEVKWTSDEGSGILSFISVSSDGKVNTWKMMKDQLEGETVMELTLSASANIDSESENGGLSGLAGGLCFDFNPSNDQIFLLGTEEGKIFRCSRASTSAYLSVYEGHSMAVYSVKWNPFHDKVFLSASADWSVKLWSSDQIAPLLTFDLGQAVGDVSWAAYSSSVWSAITADGTAHFYDLNVNRQERILYQKVSKKSKLTHIAFNKTEPVVLVGDDRGGVNCLKLSPNLRIISAIEKGKTKESVEKDKMTKVVQLIRSGEVQH